MVDSPVGKLGLCTCYDLRFPEQSLLLRQKGSQILAYPSAFTLKTGAAHWEVLLRARAIETQCYVVAAALKGKHHSKRESYGHSMIVDPWGTVISRCRDTDEDTFAVGDIDLKYLEKVRLEIPVLSHRRHDVYSLVEK